MHSRKAQIPAFDGRAVLSAALFGSVLGLLLTALDAPLWVFYVAPISMAPLLVFELRRLDAIESSGSARN